MAITLNPSNSLPLWWDEKRGTIYPCENQEGKEAFPLKPQGQGQELYFCVISVEKEAWLLFIGLITYFLSKYFCAHPAAGIVLGNGGSALETEDKTESPRFLGICYLQEEMQITNKIKITVKWWEAIKSRTGRWEGMRDWGWFLSLDESLRRSRWAEAPTMRRKNQHGEDLEGEGRCKRRHLSPQGRNSFKESLNLHLVFLWTSHRGTEVSDRSPWHSETRLHCNLAWHFHYNKHWCLKSLLI